MLIWYLAMLRVYNACQNTQKTVENGSEIQEKS